MKVPFVDLKMQYRSIAKEVDQAIKRACRKCDFILGEEVFLFEEEFAHYCNTKFAVGVDSGTSALELSLRVCGIGKGDEVITVPNSFIATASAITFTGAKPVFVDIDSKTYNMDFSKVKAAISKKTKAIIPVHLYGHPVNMDPIINIARKRGIVVIEDASQAHGALYKGKPVGSFGNVGCFSFYPSKNLGAYGDGGILVTNNRDFCERAKMLRNYGQKEKYHHLFMAYNRRLDTLQAAILRIKLRKLNQWNEMRRKNAQMYNQLLPRSHVIQPYQDKDVLHVYHLYVISVKNRDKLRDFLQKQGISTNIHYPIPIHLQKAYKSLGLSEGNFPITEKFCKEILSLPMFPELRKSQIYYVASKINEFYHL